MPLPPLVGSVAFYNGPHTYGLSAKRQWERQVKAHASAVKAARPKVDSSTPVCYTFTESFLAEHLTFLAAKEALHIRKGNERLVAKMRDIEVKANASLRKVAQDQPAIARAHACRAERPPLAQDGARAAGNSAGKCTTE